MWKTVIRRVLLMIPQVFILSILVFILAKQMPGDPFKGMITPDMDAATVEVMKVKSGFYDPWYVQYKNWISDVIKGDFGNSIHYRMPVVKLLSERIKNTFALSLLSVVLTYSIAIPLGLLAGRYNGSKIDNGIIIYNFISYAMPSFVFYLSMILIFGYKLHWFPTGGSVSVGIEPHTIKYMLSRLHHILLPALCASVLSTTGIIQYLRNEVIDAKTMDYVRTARSKGVPMKVVYKKHIFRNSILPIAAFFGFTIVGLLGGSVLIETVFSYPGMGSLFVEVINVRDYSVITTLILLYGFLSLLGSLLSDIIMTIVDPRIRIE